MKEESILNVLMYLFKNHMQNNCELTIDQTQLLPKLEKLGFNRGVIDQAFNWLDNLAKHQETSMQIPMPDSIRIFNDYESACLSLDCRRFLISLEQQGIINAPIRELIINQVLELEQEGIDVALLKWVTLIILFNRPTEQSAENRTLNCLRFLLLEDTIGGVH